MMPIVPLSFIPGYMYLFIYPWYQFQLRALRQGVTMVVVILYNNYSKRYV